MKRSTLFFFILFGLATYLLIQTDYYVIIFNYIVNNLIDLKDKMGIFATVVSVLMYFKLRFFDAKLFNRLQNVYGKQKFIQSLQIMLVMLEIMEPEEVFKKIMLISDLEVSMRKSLNEINTLLNPQLEKSEECKLELSRSEKKELERKVKVMLDLIDKRLDMHYISKDIKDFKNDFSTFLNGMSKAKKRLPKLDDLDKKMKEQAKSTIIKEFGK